ncbi:vitamin-D-receptor interacting mediator subunit 4-domain-containing protein [Amylocarpus encephaloides]|uniref:Mediator of RNA polymerase II transcription subunit 4 n=1 Tax=Amylocarpus encephaloides TaxID=45428 RepID=A0A9P7YS99_9HELO|nr:vitamin-D-receptor interacting mediator subunit 4-domain-containing protein [Amylocarpus encephaloides]
MNQILDERFERVEKALATLIHSLSTYNPSAADASNLVAADAELSQGLEKLAIHQANHTKIEALRATADDLDTQIRDTLALLTTTRKELLSISPANISASANPVSYSELLSFARRISKFTLPASYREGEVQSNPDTGDAVANTPKESVSQTQTNGTSTPITTANGVDRNAQLDAGTVVNAEASLATGAQQMSQTSLPADIAQHLNVEASMPFIPWPNEDTIRRGALASIEILINKGVDPATFDPEKSEELEKERQKLQDEEDRLREEVRTKAEEERRKMIERRMSISGGAVSRPNIKQAAFQLDDFEDDDED